MVATAARGHPRTASLPARVGPALLAGRWLAHVSDWLQLIALLVLVSDRGGMAGLALLLLVRLAPRLVTLPHDSWFTAMAARHGTVAEAVRAIVIGTLTITSELSMAWLWLAIPLAAALGLVADTARDAALESNLPPERIAAANVASGRLARLAFVIGPAVGGLLLVAGGTALTFLVAAAVALGAALLLGLVQRYNVVESHAATVTAATNSRAGAWSLTRWPVQLLAAASGLFLGSAASSAVLVALPALVIDQLSLPAAALGPLLAAAGVGALVGPLPVLRLLGRLPGGLLIAGTALGQAAGVIALVVTLSAGLAGLVLLAGGALAAARDLAATTTIRRLVPTPRLEAVFSRLRAVVILGQVTGALVVATLAWSGSVTSALLGLGTGIGVLALLALLASGLDARRRGRWTDVHRQR